MTQGERADKLRERVDALVERYRQDLGEDEEDHGVEDEIYHEALRLIAEGYPNPQELAAMVLTTESLDFHRWCR